jgi:hypothetical protein
VLIIDVEIQNEGGVRDLDKDNPSPSSLAPTPQPPAQHKHFMSTRKDIISFKKKIT